MGVILPDDHLAKIYPETGPLRRELYKKHMRVLALGRTVEERWFMAGNRLGKSWGVGAYETALHLTGLYPPWWDGIRFDIPPRVWVAGETKEKTRDAPQAKLTGRLVPEDGAATGARDELYGLGNGMIPGRLIAHYKTGSLDGQITDLYVRHVSGGLALCQFKSYEQGVVAFASNEIEFGWGDEEPPMDVYTEWVLRTMTTGGRILLTATPLQGYTELVVHYLGEEGVLSVTE